MATMTEPQVKTLVQYRGEGGLAIIELDDPPANTYTYDMMRQLDEAILRARFDDTVHVIVLRGHGDKFFSAGANIGMLNTVTPRFKYFFWVQVLLYGKQFCPPHKASKAVGLIKRAVQSGAEVPFESALAIERELQQQLFQSEDAKEGIAANQEKRMAEFKGK